jgi:hypothetical protein
MSNLARIGQFAAEVQHFYKSNNAYFEVNLSTVVASVCVKFRGNRSTRYRIKAFFEIQYGGRPPSWIPHKAIFEGNIRTELPSACVCRISSKSVKLFPSYANFS